MLYDELADSVFLDFSVVSGFGAFDCNVVQEGLIDIWDQIVKELSHCSHELHW